MSKGKTESTSVDNYPVKSAKKMHLQEISNWIALCNALKFINNTSELTGTNIDEKDIDYRAMLNYINAVGGDIATCLRETNGIPFKYSLNSETEDSCNIEEISYEFLN